MPGHGSLHSHSERSVTILSCITDQRTMVGGKLQKDGKVYDQLDRETIVQTLIMDLRFMDKLRRRSP
jgi:hypothetical protein